MKLHADELKNAQAKTLSFRYYEENREINWYHKIIALDPHQTPSKVDIPYIHISNKLIEVTKS